MQTERPERPVRPRTPVKPETPPVKDAPVERERPERAPRKKRKFRLFKLVVFVFVAAWLFGIGVMVGRGTAPIEFDTEELRSQLVTAGTDIAENIARMTGKDENGMGFFEDLSNPDADTTLTDQRTFRRDYAVAPLSDEELAALAQAEEYHESDEMVLGELFEGKTLAPAVRDKTAFAGYRRLQDMGEAVADAGARPTIQAPPVTPPQTVTQQPPATQEPPRTAMSSNQSDIPKGSFSVQVAAVRGEDEAKAYLRSLGEKGFSGRVEKTIVGEGTWYRVRVGLYANRADAEADLQRLVRIGVKSPMIVTN